MTEKQRNLLEVVKPMYQLGYTYEEIAQRTGTTRQTISRLVKKCEFLPRPSPLSASREKKDKVFDLFLKGYTFCEIAKMVGIARQTASKWIKSHYKAIEQSTFDKNVLKYEQAKLRYQAGESILEISMKENIPKSTVQDWAKNNFSNKYTDNLKIKRAINALLDLDYTPEEIANLLKISKQRALYHSVKARKEEAKRIERKREELKSRPKSATEQEAADLIQDGLSYAQTAEVLNISRARVYNMAKRMGIEYKHERGKRSKFIEDVLKLKNEGYSYSYIAQKTGISETSIRKWCKI